MGKKSILRNNKGASLVLVLIAMLFVGIIGGIVLTLTVGNSKSTKATIDTSENFYTSESALDDFQMFIKKIATSAATQAYAETLEDATITEANFAYHFKKQFYNVMKENTDAVLNMYAEVEGTKTSLNADFIKNQISAGRADTISIKIGGIEWNYDPAESEDANLENSDPVKLKSVEISLKDESGYESKVTADVTIRVNLPKTEWEDTSGDFTYDIDHYVMIAGDSINPGDNLMAGDITGSVYTYGDLNIRTKTPTTYQSSVLPSDRVDFKSDSIIVGGDINVNGRMSIAPIADTDVSEIREKPEKSESGADEKRNLGVEVWCENLKVSGPDSEVAIAKGENPEKEDEYLTSDIYFRKNLELNGKNAKFTATCDRLYGYSGLNAEASYTGSANLLSSAIILNGLGASLDLTGVDDLRVAGTAYTALPSLDGVDSLYNYYNGTGSEPANLSYYTQGESITYRALQALYLIPGDFIKGIGHNPMKKSEFDAISESYIDMDAAKDYVGEKGKSGYLLGSTVYKAHTVRYMSGADSSYVYLFWNFASTDDAVTYFNRITASKKKYEGLVGKQLDILGNNTGSIKLPAESKVSTKGNAIVYDSGFSTIGSKSVSISQYDDKYKGMKSELNDSVKLEGNLIDTMFDGKFDGTHLANKSFSKELPFGVLSSFYDANGNAVSYKEYNVATATRYYLITGPNVQLGSIGTSHDGEEKVWNKVTSISGASLTDFTYIIITPGDVDIQMTGNFRGMIIAGGTITVAEGLNMECLGMVTRTPSNTNEPETISEFQALLGITSGVKEDSPLEPKHANNRLEAVFNVFNNSGSSGGKGNEFVSLNIEEFNIN